ncbi:MAG: pyridoxine 5'-phosphate synthase [Elusimicrobiota bacterium]
MVKLGVNIDHIATLRQARKCGAPDLLSAAKECVRAGADGITIHLREDRRHIQDEDVYLLRKKIKTRLNLEMSISPEIVAIAADVRPHEACLVPEKRQELTTEGGLDVFSQKEKIRRVIKKLKARGITVSVFINPDEKQVAAAKECGADCVELHTGRFAGCDSKPGHRTELLKLEKAAKIVLKYGLILNAGHGLDYENVLPIARIPGMHTLNIGFSIVARSVFTGLHDAVREMKGILSCAE